MAEKRIRASWSSDFVNKSFLEACVEELTNNGREGCGLKPTSYDVVGQKLKEEHDFVVDRKQMKNRYDYLKSKYTVWLKLKNKTGNVYNAKTNKFNLKEEEWQAEIKLNPVVAKLRSAPLLFPDLCTQLFEGATSTGCDSWGPSSKLPHPAEVFNAHDFEDFQMEDLLSASAPSASAPVASAPRASAPRASAPLPSVPPVSALSAPHASEESSGRSNPRNGGKRNAPKDPLDDDLREVGKEIIKAAQAFAEGVDKEMDECMEKLATLGWGEFDPRYTTALMLFAENPRNMKVWLRLKLTTCESWVKGAGMKFGLLG